MAGGVNQETPTVCDCGIPYADHYTNPVVRRFVERQIKEHGWTIPVVSAEDGTTYMVPRHWIALHGLKMPEAPALAAQYGWEIV